MAVDVKDLTSSAQDKFLSTLEYAQDAVLEGVKLWNGAVKSVVPDSLFGAVPGAEYLPSPAAYVDLRFDFAEKLLAQQREFFTQLVAETAPAVPASPLVKVSSTPAMPAATAAGK